MTLYAIAFGNDGFADDSSFLFEGKEMVLRATDETTFEELLAAYREREARISGWERFYEAPVGFWLLTAEAVDVADAIIDGLADAIDGNPWSDEEDYAQNRHAKRICAKLALKVLGVFPE